MLACGGVAAAVQHEGWLGVLHLAEESVWIEDNCFEPSHVHSFELFDLHRDPTCLYDRASDEHERAKRMRGAIVHWLGEARADGLAGAATDDARTLAGLEALGYATAATDVSGAWIDPNCACDECAAYAR
jgi:hypothetical protein